MGLRRSDGRMGGELESSGRVDLIGLLVVRSHFLDEVLVHLVLSGF